MFIYGSWGVSYCNNGIYEKCSQEVRLSVSYRHILWVDIFSHLFSWGIENYFGFVQSTENQSFQRVKKGLQRMEFMRIVGVESIDMVGEHSRKEPMREAVWEKLEKGGIENYIAKFHGFDPNVTNSMVNSWKDGRVKVNGVSFQITEEIIALVSKILVEGFKFYRDKKLLVNVVKDFAKKIEERNELVKYKMYYELDSTLVHLTLNFYHQI